MPALWACSHLRLRRPIPMRSSLISRSASPTTALRVLYTYLGEVRGEPICGCIFGTHGCWSFMPGKQMGIERKLLLPGFH